jgi:hypothetical protein
MAEEEDHFHDTNDVQYGTIDAASTSRVASSAPTPTPDPMLDWLSNPPTCNGREVLCETPLVRVGPNPNCPPIICHDNQWAAPNLSSSANPANEVWNWFMNEYYFNNNNYTFSTKLFAQGFVPSNIIPSNGHECNYVDPCPSTTYECVNGNCVDTGMGTQTLQQCQASPSCSGANPGSGSGGGGSISLRAAPCEGLHWAYLSHVEWSADATISTSTGIPVGTYQWYDAEEIDIFFSSYGITSELPWEEMNGVIELEGCCDSESGSDGCCDPCGCNDDSIGTWPDVAGNDRNGNPCGIPCEDPTFGTPLGFAANNFNVDVLNYCDDGSCSYPNVRLGCIDDTAYNYNALATADDGTCCYTGCLDFRSTNYNVAACAPCNSCCNVPGVTACSIGIDVIIHPVDGNGWRTSPSAPFTPSTINWSNVNSNIGGITNHNNPTTSSSYTDWFRIHEDEITNKCPNLAVGCLVLSNYFINPGVYGLGTSNATILQMAKGDDAYYDILVSKKFHSAPGNTNNAINSTTVTTNCGVCNEYQVFLSEQADQDVDGVANEYTSTTQYLKNYRDPTIINTGEQAFAGEYLEEHAFIILEPTSGGPAIRASEFAVGTNSVNSPVNTNPAGVPTYYGSSIHPRIGAIRFEDEDNPVFTNYNWLPSGEDPNPSYSSSWTPTINNKVRVIVEILPTPMPTSDLNLTVDIDKISSSSGSRIFDITISDTSVSGSSIY